MSPAAGPELEPRPFEAAAAGGNVLRGEASGAGPVVVQAHGITAVRSYVTHGSKLLPRRGFTAVMYDARGHGESDPAPAGEEYDVRRARARHGGGRRFAVSGERGWCSPAIRWGPIRPRRSRWPSPTASRASSRSARPLAASLLRARRSPTGTASPPGSSAAASTASSRSTTTAATTRSGATSCCGSRAGGSSCIATWTRWPRRCARPRGRCRSTASSRSRRSPCPTLVVASHDDADPGHPYAVAEEWSERIPGARLISEAEGESPLAWQGGKLSREIAAFCEEPAVSERLGG